METKNPDTRIAHIWILFNLVGVFRIMFTTPNGKIYSTSLLQKVNKLNLHFNTISASSAFMPFHQPELFAADFAFRH